MITPFTACLMLIAGVLFLCILRPLLEALVNLLPLALMALACLWLFHGCF
jgi:hypothetical protein